MKKLESFSPTTIEVLKYYVYVIVDVSTNKICHIQKGQGNSVFECLKSKEISFKTVLKAYIAQYSLTEDQAAMLATTLINFITCFYLSDLCYPIGVDANERSIIAVEDIESKYAPIIISKNDFKHNILFVSIDNSYDPFGSSVKLYENSRKAWPIDIDKVINHVDFVIATYNGIFKEIYKAHNWEICQFEENNLLYKNEDKVRYKFTGDLIMNPEIRDLYINKKLDEQIFFDNSVRYLIDNKLSDEKE